MELQALFDLFKSLIKNPTLKWRLNLLPLPTKSGLERLQLGAASISLESFGEDSEMLVATSFEASSAPLYRFMVVSNVPELLNLLWLLVVLPDLAFVTRLTATLVPLYSARRTTPKLPCPITSTGSSNEVHLYGPSTCHRFSVM